MPFRFLFLPLQLSHEWCATQEKLKSARWKIKTQIKWNKRALSRGHNNVGINRCAANDFFDGSRSGVSDDSGVMSGGLNDEWQTCTETNGKAARWVRRARERRLKQGWKTITLMLSISTLRNRTDRSMT